MKVTDELDALTKLWQAEDSDTPEREFITYIASERIKDLEAQVYLLKKHLKVIMDVHLTAGSHNHHWVYSLVNDWDAKDCINILNGG